MDPIVLQAIEKWPNVPACRGWLGLDTRGRWLLRDEAVQAAGSFSESKGEVLTHEKLLAFIGRNYAANEQGEWYFQNGPQRVFVELENTPWVWRVQPGGGLITHTGIPATPTACLQDQEGHVYFTSDIGVGLVHSMDVALVAEGLDRKDWVVQNIAIETLPALFGYRRSPVEAAQNEAS